MSKILGQVVGYALVTLIIGCAVLALLSWAIMWLVPLATAGAITLGFMQGVAIVTLGLLARAVIFQNS